jgi:hypothetical protein
MPGRIEEHDREPGDELVLKRAEPLRNEAGSSVLFMPRGRITVRSLYTPSGSGCYLRADLKLYELPVRSVGAPQKVLNMRSYKYAALTGRRDGKGKMLGATAGRADKETSEWKNHGTRDFYPLLLQNHA